MSIAIHTSNTSSLLIPTVKGETTTIFTITIIVIVIPTIFINTTKLIRLYYKHHHLHQRRINTEKKTVSLNTIGAHHRHNTNHTNHP